MLSKERLLPPNRHPLERTRNATSLLPQGKSRAKVSQQTKDFTAVVLMKLHASESSRVGRGSDSSIPLGRCIVFNAPLEVVMCSQSWEILPLPTGSQSAVATEAASILPEDLLKLQMAGPTQNLKLWWGHNVHLNKPTRHFLGDACSNL